MQFRRFFIIAFIYDFKQHKKIIINILAFLFIFNKQKN